MIDLARDAKDAVTLHRKHRDVITTRPERPGFDEVDRRLEHQNYNPVKVLTSGLERRVRVPFEASGKLRLEERVPWWNDYREAPLCVFGHYAKFRGEFPFSRAICVDFAVAK